MSSNFKVGLLLAVIFIVGVITGGALTVGFGSHFLHPPGEIPMKRHWMEYLTHRLNLSADQQAKIQPIVTDATNRIQSGHHDEVERDSQILKEANDQIATFLTPDQKVELQKMEDDREKLFSGHMHPWGQSHDGPDGMYHHNGPEGGAPSPPPQPPPPPVPNASTNAAPAAP
jgi:Spy/CpxP family protein refolding chaperone